MSQYSKMYNCSRWRKLRARQLATHPLCEFCRRRGLAVAATVCDHIEPHKGDQIKFWQGPFMSLCKPCHDGPKKDIELGNGIRGGDVDGNPCDPNHHWNAK